ncbi:MAG: TraR/DksA C4-type zinc finger protein [Candidatus Dormibacteria bacterium]
MAESTIDVVVARRELESELRRLETELTALEKGREAAREDKDEHAGYGNNVGEAATETSEAERDTALISNLTQMRSQVEHALRLLDEGTYGLCVTCGESIPVERLEALPHAIQCVSCKSKEQAH